MHLCTCNRKDGQIPAGFPLIAFEPNGDTLLQQITLSNDISEHRGVPIGFYANLDIKIQNIHTPSEEKDILVCIITATQLSCNYTGT